jgi:hypothetical protein
MIVHRPVLIGVAAAISLAAAAGAYSSAASAQGGYGPGMMQGYGYQYGPGHMWGHGPGMMYGPGYGPGMMQGYGPGYGPGMMYGPGYGPGMMGPWWQGQQANLNLTTDDVKTFFERWIGVQGNPRLKVVDVKEKDANTIEADIVTKEGNALVQRFSVDRRTGLYRPSGS